MWITLLTFFSGIKSFSAKNCVLLIFDECQLSRSAKRISWRSKWMTRIRKDISATSFSLLLLLFLMEIAEVDLNDCGNGIFGALVGDGVIGVFLLLDFDSWGLSVELLGFGSGRALWDPSSSASEEVDVAAVRERSRILWRYVKKKLLRQLGLLCPLSELSLDKGSSTLLFFISLNARLDFALSTSRFLSSFSSSSSLSLSSSSSLSLSSSSSFSLFSSSSFSLSSFYSSSLSLSLLGFDIWLSSASPISVSSPSLCPVTLCWKNHWSKQLDTHGRKWRRVQWWRCLMIQ